MACCGGSFYDGEAPPSCNEIEHYDARGYVELKLAKRRTFFKRKAWYPRFCVLADSRLFAYKDTKGKSYDRESLVIDLRDTVKISVRSYVALETDSDAALTVGCVMTITDRRKKKHKLRFGTGEERQYWTGHLAKATGKAIADFEDKGSVNKRHVGVTPQVDTQPQNQFDQQENQEDSDVENAYCGPAKEVGADELAEKRRNADDYVKWLQRRDTMLERRERNLCAEIEAILPVRTHSAASALNTVTIASHPGNGVGGADSICDDKRSCIIPEFVVVEKLDDQSTSDMEIDTLQPSMLDTCPSLATVVGPVIDNHEAEPMEAHRHETKFSAESPSNQNEVVLPIQRRLPDRVKVLPPPVPPKPMLPPKLDPPKKRPSPLITKMQEIFSAQEKLPCPGSQNLRSLLAATKGTVQFPAYRRANPVLQCHKLITPPRPKWWSDAQQNATTGNKPLGPDRFKFDRSANPVWKALNEKSVAE